MFGLKRFFSKKDIVSPVLFTVGKIDWLTFKPIVEAFIERSMPFRYWTMDREDPGLQIKSEFMASRHIGSGAMGFARAAMCEAPLMIATVTNIGTKGFPLPRPAGVKCLAHVFHCVTDVATYRKGSLDHYDAVLLGGEYMREPIRRLEALRGLPAKECVPVGLPYLDELAAQVRLVSSSKDKGATTLLLAPSWGKKGFLAVYGYSFIRELAAADVAVIVRPHPHSLVYEKELLAAMERDLGEMPNIRFDFDPNGSRSLSAADVMISDCSGIRFDFAFIRNRPVITIEVPLCGLEEFEYGDIGFRGEEVLEKNLGPVIRAGECSAGELGTRLLGMIKTMSEHTPGHFAALRDRHIPNFGCSGHAVAEWAIAKCAGSR